MGWREGNWPNYRLIRGRVVEQFIFLSVFMQFWPVRRGKITAKLSIQGNVILQK